MTEEPEEPLPEAEDPPSKAVIRKIIKDFDSSGTVIKHKEIHVQSENLKECKKIFDEVWKG